MHSVLCTVFSGTSDNRIQRCPKCLREFNLRCALKEGILPMPCARQPEFRDGCPSSRRSWVRSPPPLPTILLAGRYLAKTRGGKKGQISLMVRFRFFFQRHG